MTAKVPAVNVNCMIYDHRPLQLGEGPFWHPMRQEFFWFDILGRQLLSRDQAWSFADYVSAAGWVDERRILLAGQASLSLFDLEDGSRTHLFDLEASNVVTRSNDGRADPYGGFWIGTMGIELEKHAGAIYRWYRGELRQLWSNLTVPNSICFSPDGSRAYFTDTDNARIMATLLDNLGWPVGEPTIHVDLQSEGVRPDGSVVDAEGRLWNAQFGAGRVVCYGTNGRAERVLDIPARQTTCPAFGGGDLDQMLVTSAAVGLSAEELRDRPDSGKTFLIDLGVRGQPEHRVLL